MANSHYVPKFILKQFSDKLCLYNVKTGIFEENVRLEKAYAEKGFYTDEIEEKLNLRMESDFAKLLLNKILKCEKTIELSRKELRLIKKFLLISIIRSMGSECLMQKEKHFYDTLVESFMMHGMTREEAEKAVSRPFIETEVQGETERQYWMRTLDVILDTDGSPEKIIKHPNKTYPAYRWAKIVNAGYLAFWDSEYTHNQFVITDIGMTSENEKGWNGITNHNSMKILFLKNLMQKEKDENARKLIAYTLQRTFEFHENFAMFPISAKRMIVQIAPFYKFRQMYKHIYTMPKLENLTELANEELYFPNTNYYVCPQDDVCVPCYNKDDRYIYSIKQLTSEETRYCNALFLDRIDTTLGFSSLDKVVRSILYYRVLNSYPNTPRVDYDSLYKVISKRYG